MELNKKSSLTELCKWLKTSSGNANLDVLDTYAKIYSSAKNGVLKKHGKEYENPHKVLLKIKNSKPIGAKVFLDNLKSALADIYGKNVVYGTTAPKDSTERDWNVSGNQDDEIHDKLYASLDDYDMLIMRKFLKVVLYISKNEAC